MIQERFYNMMTYLEEAFEQGDFQHVKSLAEEYLALAELNQNNWNYGNAIHHSNIWLGRIALMENDLEKAKNFLLKAAQTKGSPQLNSFGPNMTLAKELLEMNEPEVVLNYINSCKKFWKWYLSWFKIRKWKKEIRKGNIPNFGSNLYY